MMELLAFFFISLMNNKVHKHYVIFNIFTLIKFSLIEETNVEGELIYLVKMFV